MIRSEAKDTSFTPGNIKILLTDDDSRLLDSLSSLLEIYGYDIDTAVGGKQSIEKLSANYYDLLLLDLKMPDISGHDVMRFISDNHISTTVIVVSGESSADHISRALKQGAYDYIRKPYAPEELTSTINNAARRKLLEKTNQLIQAKLNRSEKLHRHIVNNSPDIIYVLDNKDCFSFLNSKIESLLGFDEDELLGKPFISIVDKDDQERTSFFFERALNAYNGAQSLEVSLISKHATSEKRSFEISIWPIDGFDESNLFPDTDKRQYRVYGTARDITDRIEAEAFINFQAYHDLLTRLPNRSLFKDRLSVAITQAQRNNSKLSVMFIDLDRFKIINDSLGHTMGDRLLQSVSQRLLQCIRKGDTLSRFGGDEFTLLLPDTPDTEAAIQVAKKILTSIKKSFKLNEHDVYVGASIGIAIYPDSGTSMDALIKHADIAMYRVKHSGKDGYQVFSHDMNSSSSERLMLEQDMHTALENDEFEICYQPQVRTDSRKICGVEALIRWNHPKLGRLSPAEFISIAEDSHFIIEMDTHTLRRACRDIGHYHRNGMKDLQLSVNLSPLLIEKDNFVETILSILKEENFPPAKLELEITESMLMRDSPDNIDKLLRLSKEGIKLALDDFGTGYSSLSYLQKLPISTIKIDRSFIHNIKESEGACIVKAIIAMAQGLNMTIIAEGVENKVQLAYLQSLNCEIVQGYLFGKATALKLVAKQFGSELKLLSLDTQAG
jgi:diguanylate cyclase (GGDEF)-like protein/PAS domain S-box-containing protein